MNTSKSNTSRRTAIAYDIMAPLIIEAGEALYGEIWRVQLSTALGYASTCSTLRRWIDGETPVPAPIPRQIHTLLVQADEALTSLITKIDGQLSNQLSQPIDGHFETTKNRENLENLEAAGLLLFGDMWEKALATSLGYSRWGIRAWKIGKRFTPHELPWLLIRVLRQRSERVKALRARLDGLMADSVPHGGTSFS